MILKKTLTFLALCLVFSIAPVSAVEISSQNSLNSLNETYDNTISYTNSSIPQNETINATNTTESGINTVNNKTISITTNATNATKSGIDTVNNKTINSTDNTADNDTNSTTEPSKDKKIGTTLLTVLGVGATIVTGICVGGISAIVGAEAVGITAPAAIGTAGTLLLPAAVLVVGAAATIAVSGTLEYFGVHNTVAESVINVTKDISEAADYAVDKAKEAADSAYDWFTSLF